MTFFLSTVGLSESPGWRDSVVDTVLRKPWYVAVATVVCTKAWLSFVNEWTVGRAKVFWLVIPMPTTLHTVQRYFVFLLNHSRLELLWVRPDVVFFPIKQKKFILKNDNISWKRPEETCLHCTSTWRKPQAESGFHRKSLLKAKVWWLKSSVAYMGCPREAFLSVSGGPNHTNTAPLCLATISSKWKEHTKIQLFLYFTFLNKVLSFPLKCHILNILYKLKNI